jgi:hypothetical protein
MSRVRKTTRRLCRTVIVRHWRRLDRAHVRPLGGVERGSDALAQMIANFRRAIRAYRRLAKLAPSYFDTAVVERETRAREEQRRWMASWEPALEKAYGLTPGQSEARRQAQLLAEQPRPLHPRTERAMKREWADFQFWMAAGRMSRARYQEFRLRRPHDLPSFEKLAQLMEIGFDFYGLATGFDWRKPQASPVPQSSDEPDWEADLRRAYGGKPTEPMSGGAPTTDVPPAAATNLSADPAESPAAGTAAESEVAFGSSATLPPAPEPVPRHGRRDAWQTWARLKRQPARR